MSITRRENKLKIRDGLQLDPFKLTTGGTGTVTISGGSTSVTGTGTLFLREINIDDYIKHTL